jgi:hypothetical protein
LKIISESPFSVFLFSSFSSNSSSSSFLFLFCQVYNLGAMSHVKVSFDMAEYVLDWRFSCCASLTFIFRPSFHQVHGKCGRPRHAASARCHPHRRPGRLCPFLPGESFCPGEEMAILFIFFFSFLFFKRRRLRSSMGWCRSGLRRRRRRFTLALPTVCRKFSIKNNE